MISGYKCFNCNLENRYGFKFEVGKNYKVLGDVKFGVNGNGFHMCKNMEDTFRYFNTFMDDVRVCHVIGYGKIDSCGDEYNGFYEMYSVESIYIFKELSRYEILQYALSLGENRVCRFIQLFRLNSDEIELFKDKFSNNLRILKYIAYYQEGDKLVFNNQDVKKLVK